MSTPLDHALTYQNVKAQVMGIVTDPNEWVCPDGCTACNADFVMEILCRVFGRAEAEAVAVMWNQAGRDDIAGRIKGIIHKCEGKIS